MQVGEHEKAFCEIIIKNIENNRSNFAKFLKKEAVEDQIAKEFKKNKILKTIKERHASLSCPETPSEKEEKTIQGFIHVSKSVDVMRALEEVDKDLFCKIIEAYLDRQIKKIERKKDILFDIIIKLIERNNGDLIL